jgi:hypothetical protein
MLLQLERPGHVSITVAVVRYTALSVPRVGVASTFLAERLAVGSTAPVYVAKNPDFRLPGTLSFASFAPSLLSMRIAQHRWLCRSSWLAREQAWPRSVRSSSTASWALRPKQRARRCCTLDAATAPRTSSTVREAALVKSRLKR